MTTAKKCAQCKKEIALDENAKMPFFPFCSKRCQQVDLGRWLSESYAIPVDVPEHHDMLKEIQEITTIDTSEEDSADTNSN